MDFVLGGFLDLDLVGLRGLVVEGSLREGVEEEAPRARLSLVRKGIFEGLVVLKEEEVVVVVVVVVVVIVGVRWRIGFEGRGGRM